MSVVCEGLTVQQLTDSPLLKVAVSLPLTVSKGEMEWCVG